MRQGLDQGPLGRAGRRRRRCRPRRPVGRAGRRRRLRACWRRSTATTRRACTPSSTRASRRSGWRAVLRRRDPADARGGRCSAGSRTRLAISREHFASNLIRARLLSLARLWGRGHAGRSPCWPVPRASDTTSRLIALRPHPALARLAHPVPRRRHALRDDRADRRDGAAGPDRPRELRPRPPRARRVLRSAAWPSADAGSCSSGPGATDDALLAAADRRLDGDLVAAASEIGHPPVSEHRARRSGDRPQGASSSTQAAPIGAPDHDR